VIAFRCDGGARVGAGHVARCLQLALAHEAAGIPTLFVGRYDGIAAGLLEAAGLATAAPIDDIPLGVSPEAAAVVVDSYEIPGAEVKRAAAQRPVACVVDDGPVPAATAILSYHLDAAERLEVPAGTAAVLGVDYAPVSPLLAAGRRPRGCATALVTAGGGETGLGLAERATRQLLAMDPALEILVAAPGPARVVDARVTWGTRAGGLTGAIAWADIAVSAAGSTPYDLACAGVPAALHAVADNQQPIARAFIAAALAAADAAALGAREVRERLAAAGPRAIDGYGAFRARDALVAVLGGGPVAAPLRQRPAAMADAELLLKWRNEPAVREMSRSPEPIADRDHRAWLAAVLDDPRRTLLVLECQGRPVGTVRFDRTADAAEISVTLDPAARGGGLGTRAIAETTELELAARPELRAVVAEVQTRNLPSLRAFERAGYERAPRAAAAGNTLLLRPRRSPLRGGADDQQEHP
jgi:UDP-2,4-diacetamido-2,4,6-trideoxy-beta-L-altropyranose hydrolase